MVVHTEHPPPPPVVKDALINKSEREKRRVAGDSSFANFVMCIENILLPNIWEVLVKLLS